MEWHIKADSMLLFSLVLFEYKLLRMQNLFRITIFNNDPKWFSSTVVPGVPREWSVRLQIKLNSYKRPSYWLNVCLKFKSRELVYLIQDNLAHLREAYYLSDLLRVHIIKVVPLELSLLFNFTRNFFDVRHLTELAKRCHWAPKTFVNHLAQIEHNLAKLWPLAL